MVFYLVQKKLSILGISEMQSAISFHVKVLIGCLLLATHVSMRLKFLFGEADSLQQYAESIFMSSGMVVTVWCYVSLIHKRNELFTFIDKSDELLIQFKKSLNDEYPRAVREILKSSQLVEQCSEIIYLVVAQVPSACCLLPKFFYCMYCYYVKDLGSDSFELADRTVWFPFDWRNPVAYSIAITIQMTLMSYTLFVIANLLSFGIGCYLIGITSTKEIIGIIKIADERLSLKEEHSLAMKRFTDLIKWHSFIKQLITDFANLFQPIFMAAFVWSTLGISITLLMVQFQINEINLVMIVIIFFNSCYAFGLVFVVCELCQQVCNGFEEMNKITDQFYWLLYPIEVQKLLPIVFSFMQQPLVFKVFGSIECCRESFKKVVNSAFSYFMVIRRIF